jgi:hypothetical protein
MPAGAAELTAIAAELVFAPTKGTGPPTLTPAAAAALKTVPAQRPGLLKEITRLREGTLNPAVRAEPAQVPSATTIMAEKQEAIRHAETQASVAAERVAAGAELRVAAGAVAGIRNRGSFMSRYFVKFRDGEKPHGAYKTELR